MCNKPQIYGIRMSLHVIYEEHVPMHLCECFIWVFQVLLRLMQYKAANTCCKYMYVQKWACAIGLFNVRHSRYPAAVLTLRESDMVENHCFK
jgi:hypothetical protein